MSTAEFTIIARLTALKATLERMIAACGGGRVEQCRIVETLADRPPHTV